VAREAWYYPLGLARRAAALSADVVHTPAAFSPRIPDRPLVLTVHDLLPFRYPELFPAVVVAHSRLTWGYALRRAQRVVTGSEATRRELVEIFGLDRGRVAVTPYGVGEQFRPQPAEPGWLASRFGIDAPYVLCVGTLEPRKNLRGVLEAFRRLSATVEDCLLVIAGGRGWRNEQFDAELAQGADRVRLTGFVSDEELVGLYSSAAVFLYPSLYEGFGLPVLEAMACGAPVVTSTTSSLPEAAGGAALLVDPGDPAAIAAAAAEVLTSPAWAGELREKGLARARERTWDACAAATVEVYREAVADYSPR
jgi:glycosyltransferase involved in cell wall biosynthesis